jgi:FAD synthetase
MKKTVLAFGSFDLLHPGHLDYLSKARKLGDTLVVIVGRDDSIRRFKGRDPLFKEKDRVSMVGSLRMVERAVLGNRISDKNGIYRILKRLRPDVIALGYDQRVDMAELKRRLRRYGLRSRIVRIKAGRRFASYKSSRLRKLLE